MAEELVAVAAGRRDADLVVRNGRWVNVCSGEIIDGTDIAVVGARIAYCGPDGASRIGPRTTVLDADGRHLVPGLLDAHLHIESTMLVPHRFAEAVLPHGTTGVFVDPHEIANVLGLAGVRWMLEAGRQTPLNVYVQVPSCVPAAPGLETPGGMLGPAEVAEAMAWEGVIGLGEVMNALGVIEGEPKLREEIDWVRRFGGTIGGHYAASDLGTAFHAYVAGGAGDDHEGTRPEDVVARVRQGMVAMIREGSGWRDLEAQIEAVTERGIDPRHTVLCTDDRHVETLIQDGHMDDVVRRTIRAGVPPLVAIQMATLNTAERFGVSGDVGCIAPGRYADIVLIDDLSRWMPTDVIAAGEVVARGGRLTAELPAAKPPARTRGTVHLHHDPAPHDFQTPAPREDGAVRCRVIEVAEHRAATRAGVETIPVRGGVLAPDPEAGIAHLAVVERHRGSGRIGRGLVRGFGLRSGCALASTVAHDCHHLLVMGTDTTAMAAAARRVALLQGGMALVRDGEIMAELPLPIAGLMSNGAPRTVADRVRLLHEALRRCGCKAADALMTFSLLALPVIPQLRLTDRGVVDVERFEIVSLFLDGDNRQEQAR